MAFRSLVARLPMRIRCRLRSGCDRWSVSADVTVWTQMRSSGTLIWRRATAGSGSEADVDEANGTLTFVAAARVGVPVAGGGRCAPGPDHGPGQLGTARRRQDNGRTMPRWCPGVCEPRVSRYVAAPRRLLLRNDRRPLYCGIEHAARRPHRQPSSCWVFW